MFIIKSIARNTASDRENEQDVLWLQLRMLISDSKISFIRKNNSK